MNYSTNAGMCEVVFFKPSGKYYTTEAIDMTGHYYEQEGPAVALRKAIQEELQGRFQGMVAVCTDPYHKSAYPVMITL